MMQYSFVKNTTFTGTRPAPGIPEEDGSYASCARSVTRTFDTRL
jgi:hypothetical protein